MLVPALRTVGNIVTGDDMQTQVIISCGALTCLLHLLKTAQKKSIKKEACWTISNITAGTKEQIQAVIDAGALAALRMHCAVMGRYLPDQPRRGKLLYKGQCRSNDPSGAQLLEG